MIQPMRGSAVDKLPIQFPKLASVKIDGLRMWVRNGVCLSKTGKPIPNKQVQRMFSHLEGCDGELVIGEPHACFEGDDVYERSRGILMTGKAIPDADIRFYVFDRWDTPILPFQGRIGTLALYEGVPGVSLVAQTSVLSQASLDALLDFSLKEGYEGLMLRDPRSPYKYGIATEREGYLLKLKPFVEAVALILAVEEGMTNTNPQEANELGYAKRSAHKSGKVPTGTFGAFVAKDLKTGAVFNVGTGQGLTHKSREELWSIRDTLPGQYLQYRYQSIGTKNAPRLPIFLKLRDVDDVSDAARPVQSIAIPLNEELG